MTSVLRHPCSLIAWVVLAVATGSASCTSTISFEEGLSPELNELKALPVALTEELENLTEFNTKQGHPTTYEVGKLLSRFFDSASSPVVLGKVNSRLEVGSYSELLLFNKWEATYRLNVSVQIAGRPQVLSGVGTGKAGDTFRAARSASKEAIQNCVMDIYGQVKALTDATPESAPVP